MGNQCVCQQVCMGGADPNEFNTEDTHATPLKSYKNLDELDIPEVDDFMCENIWGDNMQDFQIPHLGDEQELEQLRNFISPFELERNLKFSKNGVVKFIEDLFVDNDPNSSENSISKMWENKLDNPNIKLYLKKNQVDCPFFRSEAIFEKKFKMNKLANCIYGNEQKLKWDANFIEAKFTSFDDLKHVGISYTVNKKQAQFWQRDFYEKTMTVMHDGALYRFSSSCCDQSEQSGFPLPANTVRANSEISVAKMERLPDGKIKLVLVSKCNLFMKPPKSVLEVFLSKATKAWYDNVKKHYTKNHKTL